MVTIVLIKVGHVTVMGGLGFRISRDLVRRGEISYCDWQRGNEIKSAKRCLRLKVVGDQSENARPGTETPTNDTPWCPARRLE